MAKSYKAIAAYYDAEYEHLEYLQRDVPFLISKLPRKSQAVLEIAVGTGRAGIPLAQSGHRVVGVDYDEEILEIARRKRDFVGLEEGELKLVCADARTFRLREKFDVAVILFNTLLAFTGEEGGKGDMDAVLANCHRHLKKGGMLWVDIFNPDLSLIAERNSYGLDPVTFHVPEFDRTVSRVTDIEDLDSPEHPPQTRLLTFNYYWFKDGEQQHEMVRFPLTWMMPRELNLLLAYHGFEVEALFGDYDGSEVTAASPRIIAQARRT